MFSTDQNKLKTPNPGTVTPRSRRNLLVVHGVIRDAWNWSSDLSGCCERGLSQMRYISDCGVAAGRNVFVSTSGYAVLPEIGLHAIAVYLAKCIVGLPGI